MDSLTSDYLLINVGYYTLAVKEPCDNHTWNLHLEALRNMSGHGIVSVDACSVAIKKMLDKACNTEVDLSIEPALSSSDLSTYIEGIGKLSGGSFTAGSQAHFAAIETACRNIFYGLLVISLLDPAGNY